MKTSPLRLVHLMFGVVMLGVTAQPAESDKTDPLAGTWTWHDGITVVFHKDGIATSDVKSSGVWHLESDAGFVRKYRVDWDQGKFIDQLYLSEDNKRALLVAHPGDYNIHRTAE